MIKCPHCGSTAQVKRIGNTTTSDNKMFFCEVYECGCGCRFEALYPREVGEYIIHHLENKGHIHCPSNGYDCPYWKDGICSLYSAEENWADPWEECSDFGMFWDKGDDYIDYD